MVINHCIKSFFSWLECIAFKLKVWYMKIVCNTHKNLTIQWIGILFLIQWLQSDPNPSKQNQASQGMTKDVAKRVGMRKREQEN